MAVLDHVRWADVDHQVIGQQSNREVYAPVISSFRWWARRPHALVGALLDAARVEFERDSYVVADPFSGGGTVAFEAARRKLPTYAQDVFAWPIRCLATVLTPTDAAQFAQAGSELLQILDPRRPAYWAGMGSCKWEVMHILRVRLLACSACGMHVRAFPEPFISLASRRAEETDAFFGCKACGNVSRHAADIARFLCSRCGWDGPARAKERAVRGVLMCPHCRQDLTLSITADIPKWEPVLLQERKLVVGTASTSVRLRPIAAGDPVDDVLPTDIEQALHIPIQPGLETNHLLYFGFHNWSDLYTHRQLQVLLAALRAIRDMPYSKEVRDRLAIAVLGASEMPAYLCRWDRFHPKVFEALANHRYARSNVVVEANLLSPIGRGTLPRRILSAQRALQWLQANDALPPKVIHHHTGARRRPIKQGILLVEGSSERQVLAGGNAHLVLTDPPYHDDVQYGELVRLFHAWFKAYEEIPAPQEGSEAVPNSSRHTGTDHYERLVAACLGESRRTLATTGRLLLTFHNRELMAWVALRNALRHARFLVTDLATVTSENAADHSKRGRRAFLCDLVLECRQQRQGERAVTCTPGIHGDVNSDERRNLLAMGLAVAETCGGARAGDLKRAFRRHLFYLGTDQVLIR